MRNKEERIYKNVGIPKNERKDIRLYKEKGIPQIVTNFSNFHEFYKFLIFMLSEWQLLENATSARGEFWESIFLKHSSILSIGLVPAALVLWTVWTCASGKRFPGILPVLKLHSLIPASRSNLQIKKENRKKN